MERGNFFDEIPATAPEELLHDVLDRQTFRIERIVSFGQASPAGFWYDQEGDEWVLVLRGRAGLEIEGRGILELGAGDYVDLPAHTRHRVAWTAQGEPTVWLAVHY